MANLFMVYVSTRTGENDPNVVRDIAIESSRNNQMSGISGILMGVGNYFLQVLEGDEQVVEKLLKKIEKDPRHTDLEVLFRGPMDERVFGRWSMGCVSSDSSIEGQLYFDDIAAELKNLCESNEPNRCDGLKNLLIEIPKRFAENQVSIS